VREIKHQDLIKWHEETQEKKDEVTYSFQKVSHIVGFVNVHNHIVNFFIF
jgi:hypothetical protein